MDAERRQHYLADFKPKRTQDRVPLKEAHSLSTSREQLVQQAAALRELYLNMSRTHERTTLLERTLATLDARAIAAATDVDLLRVPTDPTFIHIKGRLGKRLTAAMLQSRPAAAPPDPHQLNDSFFVQLKSPTPPPPPTPPPDPEEADGESDADDAVATSFSSAPDAVQSNGNDGESGGDTAAAAASGDEAAVARDAAHSAVDGAESAAAAAVDSETVAAAAAATRRGQEDDDPEERREDNSDAGHRGDASQSVEGALNLADSEATNGGGGGATRRSRTDSARSRRTASSASPTSADDASTLASPTGGARDAMQSVEVTEPPAAPAERRRAKQKRAAAFLPRLSRLEPHAAAASEPSTSPSLPPIAGAAQSSQVSAPAPADKRQKGHRGGGGRHVPLPELLPAPKPWRPVLLCPLCLCRTTDVAHVYEAAKWLRHRMRAPARRSVSLYGLFARS